MPAINSSTKEISLTQGKVALIDRDDYARASAFSWYAFPANRNKTKWYARGNVNGREMFLHTFISPPPNGQFTDHRNQNGLDCRRRNLRFATYSQNGYNTPKRKTNTSGYKGVWKCDSRWVASIRVNGRARYGGRHLTPEQAARAYDAMALEVAGEFAVLNFPRREKAMKENRDA